MPLLVLLPLLFSAVGALNSGYQFLSKWEADHPGSKLSDFHLSWLKKNAPDAHAAVTQIASNWSPAVATDGTGNELV